MCCLPQTAFSNLVTVIIPCYNHGQYISRAIDSVLTQTHKDVEVVVVDDGSSDCTRQVMNDRYAHTANVQYVYQQNAGLCAARNAGIDHSNGNYFVFLDADDWLADADALETNLSYLKANEKLAFVSGGHIVVNERLNIHKEKAAVVECDHYHAMLKGNYIGMHAAVMYRRWVFDEFRFDPRLKASEDYDLYLNVARRHPVTHHTRPIAVYRFHNYNMSGDSYKMLRYTLRVLKRQKPLLNTPAEQRAYSEGMHIWGDYYSAEMLNALPHKTKWPLSAKLLREHFTAFRYHPRPYCKYLKTETSMLLQKSKRRLKKLLFGAGGSPRPGTVRMGDFKRVQPFSREFGYDRGGPVDRYYIENFLQAASGNIKGRVLEVGENTYTLRFGGSQVEKSDVLHITADNPQATFVGDLSDAPHLPDNAFDCIVLTQTLQLIYNCKGALQTCYRILKPGGKLLLTVPGISHIDSGEWGKYWMWSFTSYSLQRMITEVFEPEKVDIGHHGNVLVATAFLYAMGLPEMTKEQMDFTDPQYQVIITALATK